MKCPFCNISMEKGILLGGRLRLRWVKDENYNNPFTPLISNKTIKLTKSFDYNNLEGFRCQKCKRIILEEQKDC